MGPSNVPSPEQSVRQQLKLTERRIGLTIGRDMLEFGEGNFHQLDKSVGKELTNGGSVAFEAAGEPWATLAAQEQAVQERHSGWKSGRESS